MLRAFLIGFKDLNSFFSAVLPYFQAMLYFRYLVFCYGLEFTENTGRCGARA